MIEKRNEGSRRRGRLWTVPHAIRRGPGETLDYVRVLDEHAPAFGLLLWSLVRSVELWAETAPELRSRIFAPGAGDARMRRLLDSELPEAAASPLDTLSAILAVPECADPEVVTACCTRVAGWAREAGARETAVAFAQVGALASPEDGAPALLTGVCALEVGQPDRAETWLRRALALGRRARQRQVHAGAMALLGELEEARGNGGRARRHFRMAFLAARRWGLAAERARAAYGLFRLAAAEGRRDEAARFASLAERAARRLPGGTLTLADDLPRFWLEAGEPRRALALLRRLDSTTEGEARLTAGLLRVRAALALTDPAQAKRAWADTWVLAQAPELAAAARADALLELAAQARELGEESAVNAAARAALTAAPNAEYARVAEEVERIVHGGAPRRIRAATAS